MNHIDTSSFNISSTITAILPTAQVVYTADEDGRVVSNLSYPYPDMEELTRPPVRVGLYTTAIGLLSVLCRVLVASFNWAYSLVIGGSKSSSAI